MEFDFHRMADRGPAPRAEGDGTADAGAATGAGAATLIGRLLDRLAARRHRRDVARLTAHLAWTSSQRAALASRPNRRA